jgi:hypothetical protein
MDFSFLGRYFVNYLKNHPDVVEKLVEQLVKSLIEHLDKSNSAQPGS